MLKTKSLKHRLFWTWDHSMDWVPLTLGVQEFGAYNPYQKMPEDFVQDYRNIIDFSAANGFTGVIIYGFLRDCHGGIEAAREICRHGRSKGVAVIPGIGIHSYGGVYWEGRHEFNLSRWLERHPELEAVDYQYRHHPYLRLACPSKSENRRWMRDAVRWLCETFDIGGINFETGDYGLCQCEDCRRRSSRRGKWSPADIVELVPPLVEEAQRARPGLLPICECYFDNILDTAIHAPLRGLPAGSILQFTINRAYLPKFLQEMTPEKAAKLPAHPKILRTHMGSQWDDHQRRALVARDFAAMVKRVAESGMDGVTVFGEVASSSTVNEINYLSIAAFSDAPGLTWDGFVSRTLGRRLGGEGAAAEYVKLLEKPTITARDIKEAKGRLQASKDPAYRRWLWLVENLYRRRS